MEKKKKGFAAIFLTTLLLSLFLCLLSYVMWYLFLNRTAMPQQAAETVPVVREETITVPPEDVQESEDAHVPDAGVQLPPSSPEQEELPPSSQMQAVDEGPESAAVPEAEAESEPSSVVIPDVTDGTSTAAPEAAAALPPVPVLFSPAVTQEPLVITGSDAPVYDDAFFASFFVQGQDTLQYDDGLYYLSETQANSILQMRLQRLTGLEQDKIIQEYRNVIDVIADLLDILDKPERVRQIIEDDLIEIKNEYGDDRRSEIDPTGDPNFDPRDLIPRREMVVTLTRDGYIKSQQLSDYQAQRRGGQGKKAATMKEGDMIDQLFIANSHDRILCFSDFGRMYCLDVYSLPEGSRTSKGRPIINSVPLSEGERITVVLPIQDFDDKHYVFMATANGVVKKTRLKDFANVRRSGINAAGLDEGDHLIGVAITDGEHDVMLFSDAGKAVRFSESDVRPMGRGARGVKGMALEEGQTVIAMLVADREEQTVLTATENGFGKRTLVSEYTRHGRGTKGMIAIQTTDRNGKVVAATLVDDADEVMLLTQKGKIVRTPVADISVLKRATQGVTLIGLKDDSLVAVQRIAEADVEEEKAEEAKQASQESQSESDEKPDDSSL